MYPTKMLCHISALFQYFPREKAEMYLEMSLNPYNSLKLSFRRSYRKSCIVVLEVASGKKTKKTL